MNAAPPADRVPSLRLEAFFAGRTRGWGIFQDRFGRLRRQFVVDIDGRWDGACLTLDEHFAYADGERGRRLWTFRRLDDDRYQGEAGDMIGTAQGIARGNTLNLRYRLAVPISGRRWTLDFNDWFFRIDADVLINRAAVSKLGIRIGEVTTSFHRLPDAAPAAA